MKHFNWCGEKCNECNKYCKLDESMPCSPDCDNFKANGDPDLKLCKGCDALEISRIIYKGV